MQPPSINITPTPAVSSTNIPLALTSSLGEGVRMTAQRIRHPSCSGCLAVLLSAQVFGQMTVTSTINASVTDPTPQVTARAGATLTTHRTKEDPITTTNQ